MPSTFDQQFAEVAAPLLVNEFGDRDDDGDLRPVVILLTASPDGEAIEWPCIVGPLTQELMEIEGNLVAKEACELHGATADLETGLNTLPETAQVTVTKYGETPFHVYPSLCKFGGAMTKLTVIRKPVNQLNPLARRGET